MGRLHQKDFITGESFVFFHRSIPISRPYLC